MSRKDYELLADALNTALVNCGGLHPQDAILMAAAAVADVLKMDNRNFDRKLFDKAVCRGLA